LNVGCVETKKQVLPVLVKFVGTGEKITKNTEKRLKNAEKCREREPQR